ncbi:MAG: DUF4260 domain-containing protein [Thermomicrobiales bacterium]
MEAAPDRSHGQVTGGTALFLEKLTSPRWLLRIEPAVVVIAVLALYAARGGTWWLFLLVLAPDLSMLGYVKGTEAGAVGYNLAHTFVWPALLCLIGWEWSTVVFSLGLVWAVHILVDHVLGYGLKYPESFKTTHLQQV